MHRDLKMSSKNNTKQTTTVSLGGQGTQPTTSTVEYKTVGDTFLPSQVEIKYPIVASSIPQTSGKAALQPLMSATIINILTGFVTEYGQTLTMDLAVAMNEWLSDSVEFTFNEFSTAFPDVEVSVLEKIMFELTLYGMIQRGSVYILPRRSLGTIAPIWRNEIHAVNASVEACSSHARALGARELPASHIPVVTALNDEGENVAYRDVTPMGAHHLLVDFECVSILPELDRTHAPVEFGDCSMEVKRRILSIKTPISVSVLADLLGFTKRTVRDNVLGYSIKVFDRNRNLEHSVHIFNGARMSGLYITIWGQAQFASSGVSQRRHCNWPMHPTQQWLGNLINIRPKLAAGVIERGTLVAAWATNPGGSSTLAIGTPSVSAPMDVGVCEIGKGSPLPILPPGRFIGTALAIPVGKRPSLTRDEPSQSKKRNVKQHAKELVVYSEDVETKSWKMAFVSLMLAIVAGMSVTYSLYKISLGPLFELTKTAPPEFVVLYSLMQLLFTVLAGLLFGLFLYDALMAPIKRVRQIPTEIWLRTRILSTFDKASEEYIYLDQLFKRATLTDIPTSAPSVAPPPSPQPAEVKITQEAAQPQRNIAPINLKRSYLSLVFKDALGNETIIGGATNVTGVGIVSAAHVHREAVGGVSMSNGTADYFFRDADGVVHKVQTKWIDYTRDVWVCKAPPQLDSIPELPPNFDITNLDVSAVNSKLTDTTIGKWRKVDGSKFFYHKLHLVEGDSGCGIVVRAKENKTYYLGLHGGSRGLPESTRIENYGILLSSWIGLMRSTEGDVALDEKSPMFAKEYYEAKEKSLDDANTQSLSDELTNLSLLDSTEGYYPANVSQEVLAPLVTGYVNQMINAVKHMVLRDRDGPKNLFVKTENGQEVFNYGLCTLYHDPSHRLFVKLPNGKIVFFRCQPFGPVYNELMIKNPDKWASVKPCYSRAKINPQGQIEYEVMEVSHTPILHWGDEPEDDTVDGDISVHQEAAKFLETKRLAELRAESKSRVPTPPPAAPQFAAEEEIARVFTKLLDARAAAAKLKREEEAALKKAAQPTPAAPKPKKEKAKKQPTSKVVQESKPTPTQKAETAKVSVFSSELLN